MTFGLPLVGAQIVLLGASVFNRDAAIAAANLHRLNIASDRLASGSNRAVAALSGTTAALTANKVALKALNAAQTEHLRSQRALAVVENRSLSAQRAQEGALARQASAQLTLANATARSNALAQQSGLSLRIAQSQITSAAAAVSTAMVRQRAAVDQTRRAYDAWFAAVGSGQPVEVIERLNARMIAAQNAQTITANNVTAARARQNIAEAQLARLQIQSALRLQTTQNALQKAQIAAQRAQEAVNAAQVRGAATATQLAEANTRLAASLSAVNAAQRQVQAAQIQLAFATMTQHALNAALAIGKITLALTVVAGALSLFASSTDRDMRFVQGITGETRESVEALFSLAQQEALRTGEPFSKLTAGFTEAIKTGVTVQDVFDGIGRAITNLTVASKGELVPEEAGAAIALMVNRFKLLDDATKSAQERQEAINSVINTSTVAVQKSALGYDGFFDAMSKAGPVLSLFNLNAEEAAAAVGVVGRHIKEGTEAGTTLQRVFTKLAAPTDKAREVLDRYNISIETMGEDGVRRIRPFIDIMRDLAEAFSDTAVAQGKISEPERVAALQSIFEVRGIRGITALLTEGVQQYEEILRLGQEISTEEITALQLETSVKQAEIFREQVARIARELGRLSDPALLAFLKNINDALSRISAERLVEFAGRIQDATRRAFELAASTDAVRIAAGALATVITIRVAPALAIATANLARMAAISAITSAGLAAAFVLVHAKLIVFALAVGTAVNFVANNWEALGDVFVAGGILISTVLSRVGISTDDWQFQIERALLEVQKKWIEFGKNLITIQRAFHAAFNLPTTDLFDAALRELDALSQRMNDFSQKHEDRQDTIVAALLRTLDEAIAGVREKGHEALAALKPLEEFRAELEKLLSPFSTPIPSTAAATVTPGGRTRRGPIDATEPFIPPDEEEVIDAARDAALRAYKHQIEDAERQRDRLQDIQNQIADDAREARERQFRDVLELEERQRKEQIDILERGIEERQRAELDALRDRHEAESRARDRLRALQELEQEREDKLIKPRGRVASARTELERRAAQIRLSHAERVVNLEFEEQKAKIERRQRLEDEDFEHRKAQEAEYAALQKRHSDENLARQKSQAEADFIFRRDQETRMANFRRTLENEERIERHRQEDEEFARRRQRELDEAEFRKKLEIQLVADRSRLLFEATQRDMKAYGEALDKLLSERLRKTLEEGIKIAPEGVTGLHLEQFQHGGVVPGPKGAPRMAVVHGGEQYLGVGADLGNIIERALTSVRAREVAGPTTTTIIHNYDYNVAASYGNIQSPSGVAQDLRALIALSRR